MTLRNVFGSQRIYNAAKKLGTGAAALSLAACASMPNEKPADEDVNPVAQWQQAQEQVISQAEESRVRTVREAASAAQRIAEGERKSFLFDRIAAAAKLEAQQGEAGLYTLMMSAFVASEDQGIQDTLRDALSDVGIEKGVIERLSYEKYVRNAAAAIPGIQATCATNKFLENIVTMDDSGEVDGPWKDKMSENPRYAFDKGVSGADIYIISYDDEGNIAGVTAANTHPDYAQYFPQVSGEEAKQSSCSNSTQTAAPEPAQP